MTQNPESEPKSMRYRVDEVLSGILASIERDTFTDDTQKLGALFKDLAHQAPLFAPFAALAGEADFSAVLADALQKLVNDRHLEHDAGRYYLTPPGRARCITSKQTLFNAADRKDLETAARYFDAHAGPSE